MKNYSYFYKTIESHPDSFFIGANTSSGFIYANKNLLNENHLNRLYILKGGPGTGKSTLMKKCRSYFEGKGAKVTSYYCSSDPNSLDAIIIKKENHRVAIADGTAPHSIDAHLPGAISEIIDLGALWNSDKLENHLDKIALLSADKILSFDAAKKYLSSANEIRDILTSAAKKGFDCEKASKAINRLLASIPNQKSNAAKHNVITEAISMRGAIRLSTFDYAKALIGVTDFCGISPLFFDLLEKAIEKSGRSMIISRSPLGEISEIFLPCQNIAFVPTREGPEYSKCIHLSRFADKEYFSTCMAKRRFNERCLMEMLDGATTYLTEAKERHFALEEIYSQAMDFSKIDDIYKKITLDIEKKLLN